MCNVSNKYLYLVNSLLGRPTIKVGAIVRENLSYGSICTYLLQCSYSVLKNDETYYINRIRLINCVFTEQCLLL